MRILATAIVFATTLAFPAHADHTWNVHWPGGPESYVMVSNQSGLPLRLGEAIAAWDASPDVMMVDVGPTCPTVFEPHSCIVIHAAPDLPAATGEAVFYSDGTHILSADVWLSPHRYSEWPDMQLSLLIHELGHALGLAHRAQDSGSVMSAPWVYAGSRPDSHDFAQLAEKGHP